MIAFILPSIENVHEWDGEHIWLLGTGKIGDVCIERNFLFESQYEVVKRSDILFHTFSAAPALAIAKETPRMAFAPSLVLLGVPSSLHKNSSIFG